MQLTAILIHLDQNISEGIIASRFNQEREQLLLVSYNSDRVNSLTLLNKAKNEGYKAQLVGLWGKNNGI